MTPDPETSRLTLTPRPKEKGLPRSMWELLLQLRVLLPYLPRLLSLVDGGQKTTPQLGEITKGMADIQMGARSLEVQARNQALQLDRLAQQLTQLQTAHELSLEEGRRLTVELRNLRRRQTWMFIVVFVLLLATLVVVSVLAART